MMNYFWEASGGSLDSIFWVPVYGDNHDKRWFRLLIWPIYRLARRLNDAKYWLLWRFHPKHQYNVVKTGLEPGYYDVDYLVLHACFALLCRYVEDEMGGVEKIEEFNADLRKEDVCADQVDLQAEALALYKWWKFEKPAEETRRDNLMMELYGGRELETEPTDNPNFVRFVPPKLEGFAKRMDEEFRALEKKIEDDEQVMLHRLIDIRRSLWT